MRVFQFQLEPLLTYRKNRRDLCRQFLAAVLNEQRALQLQFDQLAELRAKQLNELGELGRGGEMDIDRAASRRYFAGRLLAEARAIERNGQLVAQQLELCRRALMQADREVKALERLAEKRRAEFLAQEERRAARELEDAWNAARLARRRS